jgi:chemotaxis protein MotB
MKIRISSVYIAVIMLMVLSLNACVTARQYEDAQARSKSLEDSLALYKDHYSTLMDSKVSLQRMLDKKESEIRQLAIDTADIGARYRMVKNGNKELNALYEKILEQNKALLESSSSEKAEMLAKLNEKEKVLNVLNTELQERELAILKKDAELNEKELMMQKLQNDLEEREKKVNELEKLISDKDSVMTAMKNSISKALLGFTDEELTVEKKNGKIYVSMNNKLLFRSGSTTVDAKGVEALKQLAKVISKHDDFDLMIEGHTDNVPVKSGRMEDNWDLSVLRATSIVRILQENGVSQDRMIPSGRGEFMPKASNTTPEGRAQNRRIEIILSPNLDEIINVIKQ